MLEGWTTLGFMAAHTTRARLGLMVGGVHYRLPGAVGQGGDRRSTCCRAAGRGWGSAPPGTRRSRAALGFPFPPLGDRFEMLEETLRIVHAMWEGERGPGGAFEGRHYQASRLLNSPQAICRPHPPIMIGGGGERKTLRLVAQYADACNVFGGPEPIHHKYEVIREHCAAIGRDPDEIERSTLQSVRLALGRQARRHAAQVVDRFGELSTPAPST